MQTPYDSALRVQRRIVDAVRLSLLAEVTKVHAVEAASATLEQRIERESMVATGVWLTSHRYMARQADQRRVLASDRASLEAGLDRLRSEALEACGLMQAISAAAAKFSTAVARNEAGIEQTQSDDFASTRIAGRSRSAMTVSRPALALAGH